MPTPVPGRERETPIRQAVADSRAIAAVRLAGRGLRTTLAIAARPFQAVARLLEPVDRAIERFVESGRPDEADRDARVIEAARQSRLVKAVDRVIQLPYEAWPSSALARVVTPVLAEYRALADWQKVRLAGWALLVGLAARVATHLAMGEPAGWVSWLVWAGVALAAAGLMAGCRGLAAGWADWRDRHARRGSR